jgi:hypothetical protein
VRSRFTRTTIKRANIATLPHIASKASVSEVVWIGQTSVLAADDVVDLMRIVGVVFMKEAVSGIRFATV